MDPNRALAVIRELCDTAEELGLLTDDVIQELVENFEALDEWLAKGGFLPSDWAATR
jgi:hypothetical protein